MIHDWKHYKQSSITKRGSPLFPRRAPRDEGMVQIWVAVRNPSFGEARGDWSLCQLIVLPRSMDLGV